MNKWFTIILALFVLLFPNILGAQDVDMADSFRKDGKIYVVVLVTAVVFLGIVIYLISIDRKLRKMEQELKNKNK